MHFQLLEIILWARRPGLDPRRLKFEPGVVNVISGASRTGKSAVIPIIDYCLGSGTCSIPVDTIRNACAWFGIIVETEAGQMLIARREPGAQRTTEDMMIMRAAVIEELPVEPIKNTTADALKKQLDEQAGLTRLEASAGEVFSGFEGRPSFRDLAAFLFQPQNVIANPDVLFYKTGTYEHREKLRNIFPYVLGAVTADTLGKMHELARLRSQLKRVQRELGVVESVSSQWEADLLATLSQARELGLVDPTDQPVDRAQALELLTRLADRESIDPSITPESIKGALDELAQLENEETEVSADLTSFRRRYAEMQSVRSAFSAHRESRLIQRDRLGISDWLLAHVDKECPCPMCGNRMSKVVELLEGLSEAAQGLEISADSVQAVAAAFDRELLRVSQNVDELAAKLRGIQIRRKALEQRSEVVKEEQYRARDIERFLGNVQSAVRLQDRLSDSGDLRSEYEELSRQESELDHELRQENIDRKKQSALSKINLLAGRLIVGLDSEFPNAPISLSINDLTVKITRQNREDILSEIGSGSNWLSYHLAVLLALHQFFIDLDDSPVPSFLVIDQPSQVYFPKRLVARPDDPIDEALRDEDVEAVRKAFETMSKVVESSPEALQVIVLDHASRDVWGGIAAVHEVEEWRGEQKLVPEEWI